jgi:hypothetical protein
LCLQQFKNFCLNMFSFHETKTEKVKIISLCPIPQKLYGRNFRHGINKRG